MRYLCIIPARGGSKGIPRKNVKEVAGLPLIAWSINHALSVSQIDRVIVSTDCDEIADVAIRYGAEVPFMRPEVLAKDQSPSDPVLSHAVEYLEVNEGYYADAIIMLQPTSPYRKPSALSRAIDCFENTGADSLVSVQETHGFLWNGGFPAVALYDYQNRPRRQDIKDTDKLYEENGSIYIIKREAFEQSKNRLGGEITTFIMDKDESIDIDNEIDLMMIEPLLQAK